MTTTTITITTAPYLPAPGYCDYGKTSPDYGKTSPGQCGLWTALVTITPHGEVRNTCGAHGGHCPGRCGCSKADLSC